MALLPEKQRDQVMVLVCVVVLVLTGAYFMYVFEPKRAELSDMETRLDALTTLNEKANAEVRGNTIAKLRKQAESFAKDVEVMRHLVPTSNEVPSLLEQVSTAARMTGLDLAEVVPEGVLAGEDFDTYKFRIGVNGSYHQIAALLTNVASLERIVTPMNVQMSTASVRARSEHKPRKDEQLLDVKFEIQTYVVRTAASTPSVAVSTAGNP